MNQLQEILKLEESTINELKEDILYKLSRKGNGAYLKQTYQHYLQKSELVKEKVEEKIKKNTIPKPDLDLIVDRWADVIRRNMKGLQAAIEKPADEKPKPENIAHAICLIEADLKYIEESMI